ncbi:hypothetical protein ES703_54082 [subsurface metagenome]
MSLDHRVGGEGMLATIHMDIRTANADPLDPQQDLTRSREWFRHLPELNFTWFSHDGLSHGFNSSYSSYSQEVTFRFISVASHEVLRR